MNFVASKDLWLKKDNGMPKQSFSHQTDRSNIVQKCDSMCVVSVQSVFVIHYSLCLLDKCPRQHSNRHIAVCLKGLIHIYDASTPE